MKSDWFGRKKMILAVGAGGIVIVASILVMRMQRSNISFSDENLIQGICETGNTASTEMKLRYSNEYQSWKNTTDTTFRSLYNGSQSQDILAERPNLVILWAGYAFSKSYNSPRGHMYAIDDVRKSLRTGAPMEKEGGPQPASCWSCKSPDIPRLMGAVSPSEFYKRKWAAWGTEIVNPVGCGDCHDSETMELHISRSYLREACQQLDIDVENASEQQMRSLICAQCHSEYYLKREEKAVVFPWDNGLTVENMEAYYDKIGFTDFTHALSRTPVLKAQHPDYELAQMGIHAQRNVSCEECHMPYVADEINKYNDHHIQSPLAMIDRTCQTCHHESEEQLRKDVYERQSKTIPLRNRLEEELAKAHIEAKFAWERGATEKQMEGVLLQLRQAQWRWDFGTASHGASFHAPQEVMRILGDGLDKTMQARMAIVKLLNKLGCQADIPMPDVSTKHKAQQYIGLDMQAEQASKDEFIKTVIPQWVEEAKANHRLFEEEPL